MITHTRPCTTCGQLVYFIKNSGGRYVPMNADTKQPHFETCINKPLPNYKPNPNRKIDPLGALNK